jgi:putative SOS response-associated peptidase YedK
MSVLPLIVWDPRQKRRRILMARWGFPHPDDWKRPQPIHARAETIDTTTNAFADAFRAGQRGIVLMNTFNEAPDIPGPAVQHTITPDAPRGIAFLWRRFLVGAPDPLYACVMVTVPANTLIATLPTDRMPAVLAPEDCTIWLDEESASLTRIKACLKTVEGLDWKMEKEKRAKATAKASGADPGGLF